MARLIRKHRAALVAIAVYNFVFFFPLLFMGRVVSPNDIFYNYGPWSEVAPAAVGRAQNALLNDVSTSYITLLALAKSDWHTFHWNPYIACGIPGFGSSAAATLTPLVLLPLLAVPLTWFYTALIFLKLNVAFVFAYLWLREERLGRSGAAVGAIVVAGAGVYTVRWLWQITNATVFYPALLWILVRTLRGRRNSIAVMTLVALAYALAGFPAAMAYGAWMVAVYGIAIAVRRRDVVWRGLPAALAAVVLALLIAAPSIVPFVQFLRRSGYLDVRRESSIAGVYPLDHWHAFFEPDRLGNPALKSWKGGDSRLGGANNYVGATIYVGLAAIPLAFIGLFDRRARWRFFWLAVAAGIVAAMFGVPLISRFLAEVPGIKYSPLRRLALLLPLPIGYLAAAGTSAILRLGSRLSFGMARPARTAAALLLGAVVAYDLSLFAGRFHPYLEPELARIPETPTTRFLTAQEPPFRVAPFFDFLWPNTAELVRVEDVRSHFSSEADYRRMLLRIDPSCWPRTSTVITFNSLHYALADPLNALLGVRWFIETPQIDILRWKVFEATVPGVEQTGVLRFAPGEHFERSIHVDAEPFWAIELPVHVDEERGRTPALEVELVKANRIVWWRRFPMQQINIMDKVYIPLHRFARLGEDVVLRVRSIGLRGSMSEGSNAAVGETRLFYGRVTIPVIFDRQLPDARLFRNLAELPRFRAVTKVRKLNDDEFLAARDVDFASETVITDDPIFPPELAPTKASVTLADYAPDRQRIVTDSPGAFFLASSEKKTPELAITVDDRRVRPVEVDMLFAGIPVPAGHHEIVFSRRIGRGWWPVSGVGAALWLIVAAIEVTLAVRRRR